MGSRPWLNAVTAPQLCSCAVVQLCSCAVVQLCSCAVVQLCACLTRSSPSGSSLATLYSSKAFEISSAGCGAAAGGVIGVIGAES
jgi:hypothetical protein